MIWFFILGVLLHVFLCIVTFLGIYSEFLDVHKHMFFVVLFLPFWGFLIMLVLHYQIALDYDGKKTIEVERMQIDSELYKSITVEDKSNAAIIPMEEALLVNSAKDRRLLIMDVLNDNPKEYIEFLQKAGNNNDTEVVHYAVTAMVEISKENDFMLQEFERQLSLEPDNFEILSHYCEFLWQCLSRGMMQGQVEVINRELFSELIRKKLAVRDDVSDLLLLAKNSLCLRRFTEALDAIRKADTLMPDNEELLLLKIEYYARLEKGKEIKKLLDEAEEKQLYLSAKAKEAIAFWKR